MFRFSFFILSIILTALFTVLPYFISIKFYIPLGISFCFFLVGVYDLIQTKYTILSNFPIIGHFRYLLLSIRPEIHQYFIESNSSGTPFTHEKREVIYARSKKEIDTIPFGTLNDTESIGYEWTTHSIRPVIIKDKNLRVKIGNESCKKPYSSSILNISAMSFGALSKNAILAFNKGAKMGQFAHNTGEGSISPYHLEHQADLIWQIGTGYFGTRNLDGKFCENTFAEKSKLDSVKMIEIKLSQGAKPGKGGILPANKVTTLVADIRGVTPYKSVMSPAAHSVFSTPIELIQFIAYLRELSGGKPIGFKLCLGKRREFYSICKAMLETGIFPDFIAIDGGEGGTGAAPIEFSNSVGTPLTESIIQIDNALRGFNIRKHIKLIASGKITTGFHIIRSLSLGADLCASARAMMFSIGCIQALKCNTNDCPTGIATQRKSLYRSLNVNVKALRCMNFHSKIISNTMELLQAMGMEDTSQLRRWHILKRIEINKILNYSELYPYIEDGVFLKETPPQEYARVLRASKANTFQYKEA